MSQSDTPPTPIPSSSLFDQSQMTAVRAKKRRRFDTSDWILLSFAVVPIMIFLLRLALLRVHILSLLSLSNLHLLVASLIAKYGMLPLMFSVFLISVGTIAVMKMKRTVMLIDYVCFQPPESAAISHDEFIAKAHASGCFTEESLSFQKFLLTYNGLGDNTYLPPSAFYPHPTHQQKLEESLLTITTIMDQLLKASPWFDIRTDLDILIVVCSSFTTQPSLTDYIIHHFKLPTSIRCYTLSGVGTSGGLVGIDLATDLLQTHSRLTAIVIDAENITSTFYRGNHRAYLVANTLWRWGATAALLSNIPKAQRYAKYKMLACVRTNMAADDDCFEALRVEQDQQGNTGMFISKSLRRPMGHALRVNINRLCPKIMSIDDVVRVRLHRWLRRRFSIATPPLSFRKLIQHFCFHAGGIKLLNDIQHNLSLPDSSTEPAFSTLHRYGLLAGPSPFYQLAYLERKEEISPGDRIWLLSFGSGFRTVSVVWIALPRHPSPPIGRVWPELQEDKHHVYPYPGAVEASHFTPEHLISSTSSSSITTPPSSDSSSTSPPSSSDSTSSSSSSSSSTFDTSPAPSSSSLPSVQSHIPSRSFSSSSGTYTIRFINRSSHSTPHKRTLTTFPVTSDNPPRRKKSSQHRSEDSSDTSSNFAEDLASFHAVPPGLDPNHPTRFLV